MTGEREQVLAAFPRVEFKRSIVRAFANGIKHKPLRAGEARSCGVHASVAKST
jgi:hypothetical protein